MDKMIKILGMYRDDSDPELSEIDGQALSTLSEEECLNELKRVNLEGLQLCRLGLIDLCPEELCKLVHYARILKEEDPQPGTSKGVAEKDKEESNAESPGEKQKTVTGKTLDSLLEMTRRIERKVEVLSEMVSCPKCLKGLYKACSKKCSTVGPMVCPPTVVPITNYMYMDRSPKEDDHQLKNQELQEEKKQDEKEEFMQVDYPDNAQADNVNKDDDMVYLGEARFGIRTPKERLDRARTAKNRNKYALNVLELLVSKEECANMTVYGEGHGKKAMPREKRRALRSEVFSFYPATGTEAEKELKWKELCVNLNSKIRNIRNGKYTAMDE